MDLKKTTSCERDHNEELEDGRIVELLIGALSVR